ncbi:MAG: hypothetical protein ACRDL6_12745 [Solirubrobacterales bacterium]
MGLWSRLTGRLRNRGVLADRVPEDADEVEQVRLLRPEPTPTGRVPKRPPETPSSKPREIGGTAGTRRHGAQGGTPSTRRLHNPTHHR